MNTSKRWKMSNFVGLDRRFVSFAKRFDLRYNVKKKVLVDHYGEPIAWINSSKKNFGASSFDVSIWNVDGEIRLSYKDLLQIKTKEDLLKLQCTAVGEGDFTWKSEISMEDILEDTKKRLTKSEPKKNLSTVLEEFGTIDAKELIAEELIKME